MAKKSAARMGREIHAPSALFSPSLLLTSRILSISLPPVRSPYRQSQSRYNTRDAGR